MSERRRNRALAGDLIQPRMAGAVCWPALDQDNGFILMLQGSPEFPDSFVPLARLHVGGERARQIFDWMCAHSSDWPIWGRVAALFGEDALRPLVVIPADRDAEDAAFAAEEARMEQEEQARLRREINLFILDKKGRRPGLSRESADQSKPFFVMRFSEKWERERVLDWLRWQKSRFIEFRDLLAAEGSAAVERTIIAGMRETEANIKARGLSTGGRRPLRFWRGE